MKQIPYSFECEPYGDFTAVTPLISRGRLRVYYKGENRNGGFITDAFSAKLEKSLPYTPVVGDYDEMRKDFRGHNMDRNVATIYGIVPENPNIAWEAHLDKDGVERTYLCCDVYLYTGRYDAAKEIIGKPHSMELNRDSLKGDWERRGSDEVFVYQDGFFDGLCVLGDNIEPCFEGSGFFSHETGAIKILEDYVRSKTNNLEDVGLGGKKMEEDKILDSELDLEVEIEAEAETSNDFEEIKVPTTDPEEDNGTEKGEEEDNKEAEETVEEPTVEPTEPAEEDSVDQAELSTPEEELASESYIEEDEDEDKDEDEDDKHDRCELSSEASFEDVKAYFPSVSEEFEILNDKILEYSTNIATLETKVQELNNALSVYQAKEQEEINARKDALLEEYSMYLDDEALAALRDKASDYTVENLEKELLFTAKKANPNFLKVQDGSTFSSLRTQGKEGIYRILENYKQKQKNS